jgi:hypothetical protein
MCCACMNIRLMDADGDRSRSCAGISSGSRAGAPLAIGSAEIRPPTRGSIPVPSRPEPSLPEFSGALPSWLQQPNGNTPQQTRGIDQSLSSRQSLWQMGSGLGIEPGQPDNRGILPPFLSRPCGRNAPRTCCFNGRSISDDDECNDGSAYLAL